jgi:tRNA(Ile)-lysidine synthase
VLRALNKSLFKPGDRVGVAVSGGADSVALLRALLESRAEVGLVLSIVHFNHKLRAEESDEDEQFVTELARTYDLPLYRSEADTKTITREKEASIEATARDLRYGFFGRLIKDGTVDTVATAHTLDDQAETVLLRIIRGTGTSGLAGILPRLKVGDGAIVRPLLQARRMDIVSYLNEVKQAWREDSTNSETVFTRNRLRHELLPQMSRSFNPEIVESLANLAEIARSEDEFWASATADAFVRCYRNNALDTAELCKLPTALQRRVLRLAAIQKGATLDFEHTERILDLLRSTHSRDEKTVELPDGFRALLAGTQLVIGTDDPQAKPCGFSYSLAIPGEIEIPELRLVIRALYVTDAIPSDRYNDEHKLAVDRLRSPLTLRNWRPGDRFWPAHTRAEKKVKELLQDRRVASREKSLWPVALADDEIVWMRGFPVSARHAAKFNEPAVVLEELPLQKQ